MRRLTLALSIGFAASLTPATFAQLLIPDSGAGDRIMMFSEVDGSLIDVNWITDIGAVGWFFSTPKEAQQVGNEIWVPDQVANAVHRFDFNRSFLGSITAHPNGGTLANVRGLGTDGTNVWVTVFHGTTTQRGLAVYDMAGNPQSFLPLNASLFDVDKFGDNLLVSNSTTSSIQEWMTDGTVLGNFATNLPTPQQLAVLGDGSVLGTATIAAAGIEGVYHWESDGSLRRFIDTEILKGQFGEIVLRGAYLLGDDDYLVSGSTGVYKYSVAGNSFSQILGGVDAQYINYVAIPAPAALPLLVMGMIAARRRR